MSPCTDGTSNVAAVARVSQLWLVKPRHVVLNEWNQNSLDLILAGQNTKVYDLGDLGKMSPTHLRCSRRGAIPGQKSAIFSGIRSAVAFRKAAYDLVGVTTPEKPPAKMMCVCATPRLLCRRVRR